MDHLQPIAGTPIIPPQFVTIYFVAFIAILCLVYLVIHLKAKELHITHKIKKLVILGAGIKMIAVVGAVITTAYWLLPAPLTIKTTPQSYKEVSPNIPLEFEFDRPLDRKTLEKSIYPEVAGVWVFEKPMYSTHLYRKVVFYPQQSLRPNTRYIITLRNIQNPTKYSKPYTRTFTFTTQEAPKVTTVVPGNASTDIPANTQITIALSQPNDMVSDYEFSLDPKATFSSKLADDKKSYVLTPILKQGVSYRLTIRKTDVLWNLDEKKIIFRSPTSEEYSGTFTTRQSPGIERIIPSESPVEVDSVIKIVFTRAMNKTLVKKGFKITPEIEGNLSWEDDKTLVFDPISLEFDNTYTISIDKDTEDAEGGYLEEPIIKTFKTKGRAQVANFSPSSGWEGVGIHNPIKITFDQEVDRTSAQEKFSISPQIDGTFRWEGNTLIFEPKTDLPYSTAITVSVSYGIKTINGLTSNKIFSATFTTQNEVFKLSVPAYLQQHPLSCEVSALRMALAFRGITASEDDLLNKVGYDPTPHQGKIWGNPHERFVGNVNGRQMTTGYGVYWEPIARVAQEYRAALAFENWSVSQLTQAVSQGHPVIIWTYSRGGVPTYWNTPDGKQIYAVSGEHTVVVVGFVGKADNPLQIIINDPLVGQIYWNRTLFDKKWSVFNRSGVVVY